VIALLQPARAQGAVERYVAQIAAALGDEGVVVDADARTPLPELVRILRRLRPSVAHVMDVWPQAVVAARLARVPRVLLTHHTPELPRRDNLAGRAWQRLGWLARPEVIYTSETDRARDGRRPSHVVALGIDLDRFDGAEPALRSSGGPLVGNVARLAPQKDHRTLIEAARLVPEAEFVVASDGELRGELERLADGSRVRFLGARDDVPAVLASLDVFAFPSLFEGLCLAVIEAQAAGVPVVATPVGGIRETVVDGETGLLVPTGDPAALAGAIRRLLEDRAAAKAMAAEARRRVRERFSVETMVERTVRLYREPRP
jgi:glycosyltransferase involved in cell wall biosynthesis